MGTTVVTSEPAIVSQVHARSISWRKEELAECVGPTNLLNSTQRQELLTFLGRHHAAFALEDQERGQTDLVEFSIDTGDAKPHKCAPRQMPLAVHSEVARQLWHMQDAKVIQPSSSPWESLVVMVRKKDGSHCFCISTDSSIP